VASKYIATNVAFERHKAALKNGINYHRLTAGGLKSEDFKFVQRLKAAPTYSTLKTSSSSL
jgi:hypothetical protein